jgi:hypothetical protein
MARSCRPSGVPLALQPENLPLTNGPPTARPTAPGQAKRSCSTSCHAACPTGRTGIGRCRSEHSPGRPNPSWQGGLRPYYQK